MSDSIIRVKSSSNNFIDSNLLCLNYKHRKKKKGEKQSSEKKKIEKKERTQQKKQQIKKMNDLIFYSNKLANDIDNQAIYRKLFLDKYPGHPSQNFKKFASMYNAIFNKRKMNLIGSEYEIVFLLKHFKKTNNEALLLRFIKKLYRYDIEFQNTLTNTTKVCCNKFLRLYQKEELFNLNLNNKKSINRYI